MGNTSPTPAIAFFRRGGARSIAAPRGEQRALIEIFAASAGYDIAYEFAYAGASDDDLFASDAFQAMLDRLSARKAATVIVASAMTFSTDPLVHAVAAAQFRKHGIDLLVADATQGQAITTRPDAIVDHVYQLRERFEAHLTRMEERRRMKFGPQRRKNYVEMFPEAVSLAKSLHARSLRDGVRKSLREMSAILAQHGHLNNAGNPYHPDEVRRMIKGPDPLSVSIAV